MRQLPTILFDESQAIDIVSRKVAVVQKWMTAEASREWLEAMLRDHLCQGLIETMRVVAWADAGDEIADAALRRVYAEMCDRGEEPPATLKATASKPCCVAPSPARMEHMSGPITGGVTSLLPGWSISPSGNSD